MRQPAVCAPGTSWAFSDTNFVLLGEIMAKASGMPYGKLIRSLVLDRVGMPGTRYTTTTAIPFPVLHAYGMGVGIAHNWITANPENNGYRGIVSYLPGEVARRDAVGATQLEGAVKRMGGCAAVVTGGANGIGRAISERLLREGASVVLADLEAEVVSATASELRSHGPVEWVCADVARRDDVRAVVERCVTVFGRLDVMAANAGTADVVPLVEIEDAAWRRMLDVNLTGAFHSVQEAAKVMIAQGSGAVVFTASTNSFRVEANTAHYSATKFGIIGLMKTAALDLAPYGIRVNAVSPGIVNTRLARFLIQDPIEGPEFLKRVPLGRYAEASDVASAVAFFASTDAAYITGENLVVDGGTTIGVPLEAPAEPLPGALR